MDGIGRIRTNRYGALLMVRSLFVLVALLISGILSDLGWSPADPMEIPVPAIK